MKKNNKNNKNANKKNTTRYEFGPNAKGFKVWKGSFDIEPTPSGLVEVIPLHSVVSIASNALGVMAAEITTNPNTTIEYASYAARFREYRVLGVEAEWVPNLKVNTTAIVGAAMLIAQNKSSAFGTPTSYNQLFPMGHAKVQQVFERFKYSIVADDITDLDVGSTAAPGSEFSFLFYADGLTASTTYGRYFLRWIVQFSSPQ